GTIAFSQGQTITALFTWGEVCTKALLGSIATITGATGTVKACQGGAQSTTISVGLVNEGGTQISSAVTLQISLFTPHPDIGLYTADAGGTIIGSDGISDTSACEGSINGNPTNATGVEHFSGLCDFAVSPGDGKL